ncbi:FAD-binding oxidoreductase [uncultured Legionella sp.]|uniref:FAD-binding oxidoreductase n=1 Tax=uncultured Legionella sp. TaxID=210934 RepID=UPI00260D3B35|nr:FAD-binding oxidoreductase [uncultured Legionella sp.]
MRTKKMTFTNFSKANHSEAWCLRPDNERELINYIGDKNPSSILARGMGLSYSDSSLCNEGLIIDTSRLNHLIEFNPQTGIAICQGGASIKDLFLYHPEFIPPVIPGTVHSTVAGGIAHDVHGKNNPHAGSFGHHVLWFDLLIRNKMYHCSREEHNELFYATLGGLGLTGIIIRAGLQLKNVSRFVQVENKQFDSIKALTETMSTYGLNYNYQVAWLDLLHQEPRAILSLANHCPPCSYKEKTTYTVSKFPFGLIKQWNMKLFNSFYFKSKKPKEQLALDQFNNPLDKIRHWNRLYGPKGLIQFQAVFDQEHAHSTIEKLVQIIRSNKATPTLSVLKLFIQSGVGLLSFCKPGFTIAIDFIHNANAEKAIIAMNQLITELNGRIYLAKDLLLTPEQFRSMYPLHEQLSQIAKSYQSPMQSELAKRLRITE